MNSRCNRRHLLAAVLVGVLVGGGLMATTPAGAEMTQVATNWKMIWKKKLAPRADKRYYKKADSDAKYAAAGSAYSKAEADARYAAVGSAYSKAEAGANYQPKGSYAAGGSSYTKAESDAKYAPPFPSVIRGTTMQLVTAAGAGSAVGDDISFGVTLSASPTAHYIAIGAAVPVGCSGTAAAPNAAAGHLCVFESTAENKGTNEIITPVGVPGATPFGAVLFGTTGGPGVAIITTSWAVRPTGIAAGAAGVTSPVPGGPPAQH